MPLEFGWDKVWHILKIVREETWTMIVPVLKMLLIGPAFNVWIWYLSINTVPVPGDGLSSPWYDILPPSSKKPEK